MRRVGGEGEEERGDRDRGRVRRVGGEGEEERGDREKDR